MEPISADSPHATHLDEHGEGFHHLTPKVGDLPRTIENLGWSRSKRATTGSMVNPDMFHVPPTH